MWLRLFFYFTKSRRTIYPSIKGTLCFFFLFLDPVLPSFQQISRTTRFKNKRRGQSRTALRKFMRSSIQDRCSNRSLCPHKHTQMWLVGVWKAPVCLREQTPVDEPAATLAADVQHTFSSCVLKTGLRLFWQHQNISLQTIKCSCCLSVACPWARKGFYQKSTCLHHL